LPPEVAVPKKREAKTFSLGFVLRVAASVVLVMGISFAIFLRSIDHNKPVDLAAINPAYAKQQMHYASLVENKRSELKIIAKTNPELYQAFSNEIEKLDATYKKLNNDLANSPNQELVLQAMIQNLQIQTQVLNQQLSVIEQYNQVKKDQKNETKDI
jgi:predicted component of viral defense system (DUF524 family)